MIVSQENDIQLDFAEYTSAKTYHDDYLKWKIKSHDYPCISLFQNFFHYPCIQKIFVTL